MRTAVTFDNKDFRIFKEVIDYFYTDDKEKDDFIEQCLLIMPDENAAQIWDEGDLQLWEVPLDLRSHIFWKLEYLRQQIIEVEYGS